MTSDVDRVGLMVVDEEGVKLMRCCCKKLRNSGQAMTSLASMRDCYAALIGAHHSATLQAVDSLCTWSHASSILHSTVICMQRL